MGTRRLRVVEKREDGPVIRLICETFDNDALVSTSSGGTGGSGDSGGGGLQVLAPTVLVPIDAPLFTGQPNAAGLVFAAGATLENWPGTVIYRSLDGGASWTEIGRITRRSILGVTEDRLAPWAGGNTLDNCSSVTVRVHGGTLSSTTFEGLLGGANLAVIGGEPVGFLSATQTGPGVYVLTGFLRHLGGTERLSEQHFVGERFVLLDPASVLHIAGDFRNQTVLYRAVTVGAPVSAGIVFEFEEEGVALAPLSPVSLMCAPLATGGFRAQWIRRTRLAAPWVDGADAPLGEGAEVYRFVAKWGNQISFETTVANATSVDFGVGLDLTYHTIEVRQISSAVGPGYPATFNL